MFAQNTLSDKVKVLVFSECILFVDGLRQIYNGKSSFSIVRTLNTHRNLAESASIIRPDVVVFEVSKYSPLVLEQIHQLHKSDFSGKLLLLLNPTDIGPEITKLVSAGVDGFLPRNSSHDEMTNALTVVSSGGLYFPEISSKIAFAQSSNNLSEIPSAPGLSDVLGNDDHLNDCLSDREKVVLRKMAMGLCMKQIASDINLSSKTVDTYRSRAMKKLNLNDRHAVVKHAIRSGWMNEF